MTLLSSPPSGGGTPYHVVPTFASMAAQRIQSSKTIVQTLGYAAIGDGGGANYTPTATTGAKRYRSQSLDGRWWQLNEGIAFVEQFGGIGYRIDNVPGTPADSADAFDAMIEYNHAREGGVIGARGEKRYCLSRSITFDPSLDNFEGNSCWLDFRLKTFIDPASMPELLTNPSFASGGTGWTAGVNNDATITYASGELQGLWPNDGTQRYIEVGQQVTCLATDILRINVTVEEVTARNVGNNTFRSIKLTLRQDRAGIALANDISTGPLLDTVGVITAPVREAFPTGTTYTFELTAKSANPILRLQSNAQIRVSAISVKVVPANECILMRSTPDPGNTRGHNWKNFRNFRVWGRQDQRAFVDAFLFDTPATTGTNGRSSRANFYNIDTEQVGRSIVLGNNTYLNNFYSCRFVASEACIDSLQNTTNAGENIVFNGGNLGGAKIGVRNIGPMALRFFGTSIDFCRQFIVGGKVKMFGGWLETSDTWIEDGYELIDASTGDIIIRDSRVTNGGTPGQIPMEYMFHVEKGFLLHIEAETPFNLETTSGFMCHGDGRFVFDGKGGESKSIGWKTGPENNLLGDSGGFEGTDFEMLAWTESTSANTQISRHLVGWGTAISKTNCTYVVGETLMTMGNSTNVVAGMSVRGPGVRQGTYVLSAPSGTTVQLSQRLVGSSPTPGATTVNFVPSVLYGLAGMEVSSAFARTGFKSARLFKQGVGAVNQTCRFAIPIEKERAVGMEWYYKVPSTAERAARGLAALSGTTPILFQTYFVRLTDTHELYPQVATERVFISEISHDVDMATGTGWVQMSSHTNRVDDTSAHNGYAPHWATHVLIQTALSGKPDGFEMFVDDLFGDCM